jgi:hypothetical protein
MQEMDQARRDGAWPKVAALADAAHAHMDMARLAWNIQQAPAGAVGGRAGQRWLDAAGVEPQR